MSTPRNDASSSQDSASSAPSHSALDRAALALLDVTEGLAECIMDDAEAELLASAFERRDVAYQALCSVADGSAPSPAARAALERVHQLDEAMMAAGTSLLEALRGERRGLSRRRSAVQAHAGREREEPRLLTLKA